MENITAENVNWVISVEGGLLSMIQIHISNVISQIDPGDIVMVSTDESVIGIGPITVVVTAKAENAAGKVEMETQGFVLGPFVFI